MCYVAVDVFVILTGYLMLEKKTRLSRLIELWFQVFSYSLLGVIGAIICGNSLEIKDIIEFVLPISSNTWWFMSVYFLLYICIPFFNKVVGDMTQRQHSIILCVAIIVFSIWPTLVIWEDFELIKWGYSLLWFLVLYIVGAYIRKYPCFMQGRLKCSCIIFSCVMCLPLSRVIIGSLCTKLFGSLGEVAILYRYNSPVMLLYAIALVKFMEQIKIGTRIKSIVVKVSPYVLGVYLFHEHPLWRDVMWKWIQPTKYMQYHGILGLFYTMLYMFCVVILVFAVGILLEKLRCIICRVLKIEVITQKVELFGQNVLDGFARKVEKV